MKLCHCFQNTREIQLQLTNAIYLRNKNTWLKSMDLNQGWTPAGKLPLGFGNWSADENWKDVHSSLPGKHISPNAVPKTFVSLEPAVFIELKGEPVLAPVAGTSLIWVSNTERDLLHSNATGAFCYLLPHESDSIRCAFDFESVLLRRTTHTEEPGAEAQQTMVHRAAQEASSAYNPRTGTYARGGAVYGPYEFLGVN